jgi:LCP family protein required for cell wall assembly
VTSTATPPSAPGTRRRPRRTWRRVLIGSGIFFLVLALALGGAYWKLQGNIDSTSLGHSIVKDDTPKGAENILFIGSDSRKLKSKGYGNEAGQRSDALMLVHFSKGNTRIDAVQIPRDTLTDLPACPDTGSGAFAGGTNLMINSALAGGPACSARAVEKISGVRVDHFAQLDFDGFASMANALGGVNVCLDKPMFDKDAKLNLPAGKQKLNGKNLLALARTRHAVGDGSDIGRLGHQQVVMSAIISRARSAGVLTRPDRLFKFLNALTKSITVDKGISSIPKLTGLAKRAKAVPDKHIRFITMPNAAAPTDPNRVVKTTDAETIFAAIAKDRKVPVESSSSTATVPSTPVKVLNAAGTTGLASQAQIALTKEKFVVAGVGEAQKTSIATRIFVDTTPEALKTAKALNKKFGFKAQIVQQPSGMTGVWLIVGSDRTSAGFATVTPDPVKATTRTASDSLCS